jgi:hypothetical protein
MPTRWSLSPSRGLVPLRPVPPSIPAVTSIGPSFPNRASLPRRRVLVLLLPLFLSSCFIPEKFTATLNVTKDYVYAFEYDGIIAFGPALAEIAKKGTLSQKAEDDMRNDTAKTFRKEDGFNRATYQGKGRWSVHCKKTGTVSGTTRLFGEGLAIVTLDRQADGGVSIKGLAVDATVAQQLKAINCTIDGKLEVTTDMKVVTHNATETPKLLGLIGHYGWRISTRPKLQSSSDSSATTVGESPPRT